MAKKNVSMLRRRALQICQNKSSPLYVLCLTSEDLQSIAEISRISRNNDGKLIGYQRPEVKRHVLDIVEYLDGPNVLFPNSLILALSSKVRFVKSRGPDVNDGMAIAGVLEIPIPKGNQDKPAWIVDGQQRALALSKSKQKNLPIPVNAFVSDELELQRDQFLRVNNTKPLPRGLISELLPEVSTQLPSQMAAKRIPSAITDWLNTNDASPFQAIIRRASTEKNEKEKTVIADASVVKMIEESLSSPSGCLFPFRNIATSETDFSGICGLLITYWNAVKQVFPNAWGISPSKSRLMHGAGIRSMGKLMDRIMSGINIKSPQALTLVKQELNLIAPICRWTNGEWEELNNMRWDEIQNVPRHIRLLSNLVIRSYVQSKSKS